MALRQARAARRHHILVPQDRRVRAAALSSWLGRAHENKVHVLDGTEKTISLARDRCMAPDRTCRTAVFRPRKSGSITKATATPWSASGVTSVLMAGSRRS